MKIICVEKIDSTHSFLCKKVRKGEIKGHLEQSEGEALYENLSQRGFDGALGQDGAKNSSSQSSLNQNKNEILHENSSQNAIEAPFGLYALEQTSGVGSRDNAWQSKRGNLHLSFCLKCEHLASDLPLSSASIYFAFIFKEVLVAKGSAVWCKYPNDLYINDKKIGGVMSSKINDFLIISLGLNVKFAPPNAAILDISVNLEDLVKDFAKELEKNPSWKEIFEKYMVEFQKSKTHSFHYDGKEVPLNSVLLCDDGSILYQNKRIYSLR